MKLKTIYKKGFKNNIIDIVFKDKYNKNSITYNNLLTDCMTYSTKKYPTKRELLMKYEYLYDSYIKCRVARIGKNTYSTFSLEFLDPKYCDEGYLNEVIELLFDLIYKPNIDKDGFDKKTFDISKNNYKAYLETVKENPAKYATTRSLYNMDPTSISAIPMYGDLDILKNITRKDLLKTYDNLINNTEMFIYVCGDLDMDNISNIISKYYKDNNIKVETELFIDNKKRDKVDDVIEYGPYNQDILNIIYNMDNMNKYEREILLPIYNYILGSGGLTSKLYDKVREKNSLCYTIYSYYSVSDRLFHIYAGFNKKDKELCLKLINECMNEMETGKFTKKELEDTKKYFIHSLDNSDNSIDRIINYNIAHDMCDTYYPYEKKDLYKKVTKEEIIDLAKKIHINTIYILGGES